MTTNRTRSTSSKKAPAKKAGATKTTSKKTSARSSSSSSTGSKTSGGSSAPASSNGHSSRDAPRAESAQRVGVVELAARAAQQLAELTGRATEGVTRLERTEEGWTVDLEVVELRRIPETTDVLATYQATLDDKGRLESYQRVSRYVRGAAGQERA